MKIGFVQPSHAISPTGGVRIQGLMWKEGLEALGHEVELISLWNANDWKAFDAFIFFGSGGMFLELIRGIQSHNRKIAVAPIIDPHCGKFLFRLLSHYTGYDRYNGMRSRFYNAYKGMKHAQVFFTRSNQETEYLHECLDVPMEKIFQIPLSVRFSPLSEMPEKENFCFHASRLRSENKNVERLIEAAKRYGFPLKLAGMLQGKEEEEWLRNSIKDAPNIEYLGLVSDEQLIDLYRRCKVFALPSLIEGVGMVALEAAGQGAEVVLTNIGAPKEYFQGKVRLVDPYQVDEIGQAIVKSLDEGFAQPELMHFVDEHYSLLSCMKQVADALQTME